MKTILPLVAIVLGSPALAQDRELAPGGDEGCWVRFHADRNFQGETVRFTGRTNIESFEPQAVSEPPLQAVGGAPFLKQAGSVEIGPRARLVGYSGPWFDNRSLELPPHRRIPDLAALGFHQSVASFKVFCMQPRQASAAAGGTSPGASALFRKLDRDNDGALSEAELWSRIGEDADWAAVDRDDDGRITPDEFTVVR